MIYNQNPYDDFKNILDYFDAFSEQANVDDLKIKTDDLWATVDNYRREFPYEHGEESASCFKKAAWFLVWFMQFSPVVSEPYAKDNPLSKFNINAILAFDIVVASLHNSKIMQADGSEILLSNPISVSDHSYFDLMEALSNSITPSTHFGLLTLLLEQMVYKINSSCEYTTCSYFPRVC